MFSNLRLAGMLQFFYKYVITHDMWLSENLVWIFGSTMSASAGEALIGIGLLIIMYCHVMLKLE